MPKALFKEYESLKNNVWNSSHLKFEDHYKAHSLLAEAIDNDKILYAWNCMNSASHKGKDVEIIGEKMYKELRKRHSEIVIESNKRRIISDKTKKKHSINAIKQFDGGTFFDSTGMVSVKGGIITKEEFKNNRENYTHGSEGKVTFKDWSGKIRHLPKSDYDILEEVKGSTTSKRYLIINNNGYHFKTMQIRKFIKEHNLPQKINSFVGKGVISYTPKSKNQYGEKADINGWEIICLD